MINPTTIKSIFIGFLCCFVFSFQANSQDTTATDMEFSDDQIMAMYQLYVDSVMAILTYETGTVIIKDDLATINVPEGFKFLDGKNAEMVLTDIWGNPPSDPGYESLGMLMKETASPMSDSAFFINITYSDEGYIDDKDAQDIDYDELLAQMKEDAAASSELLREQGYQAVDIVGWAAEPYYDHEQKKLHWAKELIFDGDESNTLNYNIRILGRKGYLQMNVIGDMLVLEEVNQKMSNILSAVNFNEGNRYSDFNPSMDKIAAVGIGGLIAGKVLAKAGILAKLGLFLAKFWKFVAVGVLAFGAGIRRFFTGKKAPEVIAEADPIENMKEEDQGETEA